MTPPRRLFHALEAYRRMARDKDLQAHPPTFTPAPPVAGIDYRPSYCLTREEDGVYVWGDQELAIATLLHLTPARMP